MPEAYIYDHVRTPRGRGKPDGALHEVTAVALATAPLRALKERNNLGEGTVDDVILGVVDPIGEAGSDIARFAALNAGLGESVPGVVDVPGHRLDDGSERTDGLQRAEVVGFDLQPDVVHRACQQA